jgi:methionyl-tRNA formyltransferase
MSEPRVILVCGNRFALPALKEMVFFKQVAVIAVQQSVPEAVAEFYAVMRDLPVPIIELTKETFAAQLTEAIQTHKVNIGIVMAFGYRIPASVYELPEHGFFNVHSGPLPSYRGADPVFRQIKNQEAMAAVTLHKMDEGTDTGPVVIIEKIRRDPLDTHGLLNDKLSMVAARLVTMLLKLVSFDLPIPLRTQDESRAQYYERQTGADISINWERMDAAAIIALINACNPWNKGAVTRLNDKIIRLLDAKKMDGNTSAIPGTIIAIDERGITIATLNGESILVSFIYVEEGFLPAVRLQQLGVVTGQQLQTI